MGIFSWLRKNSADATIVNVDIAELQRLAADVAARELALAVCVNMTANALSQTVFRTFEWGNEVRGKDYFSWNVAPNPNDSGTEFWRKAVAKLLIKGELLIVIKRTGDTETLWVADRFCKVTKRQPYELDRWENISVNGVDIGTVLADSQVLHITSGAIHPKRALDMLAARELELLQAAAKAFKWRSGNHFKAHIDRMPIGDEKFNRQLTEMIQHSMVQFVKADSAVLPEFDGYKYEFFGNEAGNCDISSLGREIRKLVDDIFDFTARTYLIPPVLVSGEIADSKDALQRWLTIGIDPLAKALEDEINRKCYGADLWTNGSFVKADTSGLQHFDLFVNADNVAKLVGSGWSYNDIQKAIGGTEVAADWANEHYFTKNNVGVSSLKGGEKDDK